ncbi:MAG: iron ABC transporter permease [Desulfobulbaceae bacterium]|nr:MAG: iron ABC transporter permease [Desulfobulbaceae bacterium]
MRTAPRPLYLILSVLVLIIIILWAARLGHIETSFAELFTILLYKTGFSSSPDLQSKLIFVIWEIRLPRIVCAAVVGGGLAVAGCVFQSILQNPLADPYTLGISSGAAFGASSAILLQLVGFTLPIIISTSMCAFLGSLLTLYAVFLLAAPSRRFSSNTLILSGIIIASILSAGISFIKFLADENVNTIIFWIMGSFIGKNWQETILLLFIVLPSTIIIYVHARELDIMTFGERSSEALGIDNKVIRQRLLIVSSLCTAACVSVSGIIGFVGLIVPHLARMVVGPSNNFLIPFSFFCGCILLLCADTATRFILPTELPIGVLTALIGGPVFCVIFRRTQLDKWRG